VDESGKPGLVFFGFDFRDQFHDSLLLIPMTGHGCFSIDGSLSHSLRYGQLLPSQFAQLFNVFMQNRPEFREGICEVGGVRCYGLSTQFADSVFEATRWHGQQAATAQNRIL